MNIVYCIIGALGCAVLGGVAGFLLACWKGKRTWVDGFRAGAAGQLVHASGEVDGVTGTRNTRRGMDFLRAEDVAGPAEADGMTSEWDATKEMWRTVPQDDLDRAERQRVSLGMTVWCVVCTVVLCAGLLFWANRIFTAEEAAMVKAREAGRVYLGDAVQDYSWQRQAREQGALNEVERKTKP